MMLSVTAEPFVPRKSEGVYELLKSVEMERYYFDLAKAGLTNPALYIFTYRTNKDTLPVKPFHARRIYLKFLIHTAPTAVKKLRVLLDHVGIDALRVEQFEINSLSNLLVYENAVRTYLENFYKFWRVNLLFSLAHRFA